jgi:hypothetical protein
MRKLLIVIFTAGLFFCATPVMATPFYYEASDVIGAGTVTYGVGAPAFDFLVDSGSVDTNMGGFVAGHYTVNVTLANFWVDANEDGKNDFTWPGLSLSLGTYDIPETPLSWSYGALDWSFDLYNSAHLSYDFGDTGLTNTQVNQSLAFVDYSYSGDVDGFMYANIGWDTLRIDLTDALGVDLTDTNSIPEPGTFILMGAGLAWLSFYRRRKNVLITANYHIH